ncbi:hypothetical protein VTJ04DRAFT_189 [Mycothermus thermophilus]|uniref:uncharacterized protein n=1 Tax=Humicola insolens TaxID=85995 RepID=UPI003743B42F
MPGGSGREDVEILSAGWDGVCISTRRTLGGIYRRRIRKRRCDPRQARYLTTLSVTFWRIQRAVGFGAALYGSLARRRGYLYNVRWLCCVS